MSVCFAFMLSNLQYGVMNIVILKILPCSEKLWLTDRCIDSSSVWLIHQFIVCRLSFWSTVFIQTVKCTKEKQKADTGQPILIRIYINTINTSICDKTTYRIINSIFFTDIDECTANSHDCHLSATCTNTGGSFTCACNAGYTGDGKSPCSGKKTFFRDSSSF